MYNHNAQLETRLDKAHVRQGVLVWLLTQEGISIGKRHKGNAQVDPEIDLGGAWEGCHVQVTITGRYVVYRLHKDSNGDLVCTGDDFDTPRQVIEYLHAQGI